MLLPANALDKLPIFFESFKDVQSENSMFTPEICKDWNEAHWYKCGWYLDCLMSKTPYSELKLRNRFEPTFVSPIVEEDLPRSAPAKGKRKNISQMLEQSQDHDMNLDDDDVLYNFTDASSQLMRDDGITPWRGPREKHPLFYQVLIDAFSKSEGIVADLTVATGINYFSFALKLFLVYSL